MILADLWFSEYEAGSNFGLSLELCSWPNLERNYQLELSRVTVSE